jgi:hypothetical protein
MHLNKESSHESCLKPNPVHKNHMGVLYTKDRTCGPYLHIPGHSCTLRSLDSEHKRLCVILPVFFAPRAFMPCALCLGEPNI